MTIFSVLKIILVMILWAICFPLISAGLSYSPHLTFAALRAFLSGAALVALAFALRRPVPKGIRTWVMLIFVGLGATTLGFLGMFHAAEFVSPGIATVIANTQPLLAAMLASSILGESLTTAGKTGLLVGFGGIVIIALPELMSSSTGNYAIGVAYIVLAALGITISNLLIKRLVGNVDQIMAMGSQMLFGGIPLMIGAIITENPSNVIWSRQFLFSLISLSLFGTAIVYWLWFSVLQNVPLSQANTFSFLIPIFGLALGVLFYEETLGWLELGGIGLTLIGIFLVSIGSRRRVEL